MMPNFLPEITEADRKTLETFALGSTNEAAVLKRVIATYLEHFRDVRNVDPMKENVGLQVCSHLRAYDMLEEIFSQMKIYERSERKKNNSFR